MREVFSEVGGKPGEIGFPKAKWKKYIQKGLVHGIKCWWEVEEDED